MIATQIPNKETVQTKPEPFYCRWASSLEERVGITAIDILECLTAAFAGSCLGSILTECIFQVSGNSLLGGSLGISITLAYVAHYNRARADLVDQRIKGIEKLSLAQKKHLIILETAPGFRERLSYAFSLKKLGVQLQEWAKTHSIQRTIIPDRQSFDSTLKKTSDKCDVIWLRGHGNPEGIVLGSYFLSKDDPEMMEEIAKKTKKGTVVIFESCSVGEGDKNFAKDLSKACPEAVVYATQSLYQPLWGLYFQNGVPQFKNFKGKDSTRVYEAGVLQPSSKLKQAAASHSRPGRGRLRGVVRKLRREDRRVLPRQMVRAAH